MLEIRFHGRGGQGAVKASDILAMAAFAEGKEVQAFPFFGVERRGAPVTAFTRISDNEIRIHSYIYEPDILVVLDPGLIGAVPITDGLKPGGKIIINSSRKPDEFSFPEVKDVSVFTADCSMIAQKYGLGSKAAPIVNTTILGAVAKATGIIKIDSICDAIMTKIPIKKEENAQAARETFENVLS
ncbi:2-oxoacid:acceptor oxidoreductase family protein [bacterium]|nr:2-oxoacid:acceptor oxidoreductase family protein [bacterium]